MTNIEAFNLGTQVEVAPPSMELLRSVYFGLKEAFSSYTEQFILYYIYTLSPVKRKFSPKDLMEMMHGVAPAELEESKQSESLDETIKCSTCIIPSESQSDTILEEEKLADPIIEEEKAQPKEPEQKGNYNITYSTILANT